MYLCHMIVFSKYFFFSISQLKSMAKDSKVKGALVSIFTVKIEEFLNQRLTEISIAIVVSNFQTAVCYQWLINNTKHKYSFNNLIAT